MLDRSSASSNRRLVWVTVVEGVREMKSGEFHTAITRLRYAEDNAVALYLQAVCEARRDSKEARDRALRLVDKCITLDPSCADAFVLRGHLCLSKGNRSEAKAAYWRTFELCPNHPHVQGFLAQLQKEATKLYEAAFALVFKQKYFRALDCLAEALDAAPKHPQALLLQACLRRRLGRFESAIGDLEYCSSLCRVDLRPQVLRQTALTYHSLSKALFDSGNFRDALTVASEALSFDVSDHALFVSRGDAYLELADFEAAVHDFRSALTLKTDDHQIRGRLAKAHHCLGAAFYNSGMFEAAVVELSQALQHAPETEVLYLHRGHAFMHVDAEEDAYRDFQKVAMLRGEHASYGVALQAQFEPKARMAAVLGQRMRSKASSQPSASSVGIAQLQIVRIPIDRLLRKMEDAREKILHS
mmetsp:Transcript_3812/g.8061  ORF Transcript_3812/g.8061 Transcript_3812/m.8061 type:complete len:415 (+) Transcript_3812:343-1587(+)